ncbi:PD-(D/E)XK motif protein [Streptomyces sp. NBC_00198]|uniref:PD-(D/E)XK motif protein n=1 Tax=Streptomyces sp. NBC_00198 TaxID=2975677 RepID=UPI00224F7F6B|nr:PD-(D/E)XK motif protein [Streptomyces sp. NBC_00198]MCX5283560.1 PD-(D/E)XK motif protein [Streptomyces sp. NBC_00198]
MSDEALRGLIEERWTALEAEQAKGERHLRVAQLPIAPAADPLSVAVDHAGHRHLLLPIHSHRKVRPGLDGPVLTLRRRTLEDEESYQAYADLACLRDDLSDLFTDLCVDVLGATVALPENPVKALYRVLDRWKALFKAQVAPLGPDQLVGLFGELLVLTRILEEDSSASRVWCGPSGHRHDFSNGSTAVEVKSSVENEGRRPRIHGLDQLDEPEGGTLWLAWFRLRRTTGDTPGKAFVELVRRALELCDDESALLQLLARAGYHLADADRYRDVHFAVGEERWYRVGPDFPGLTRRTLSAAGLAVSAIDVDYTIDLSGETPTPLAPSQVPRIVDDLIKEFA